MTRSGAERERAWTERVYALFPAHVRTSDAAEGFPLKALVAVLSSGAAEVDGEIEDLVDSFFIETAPEGSLEDLRALVAAPPLRPMPDTDAANARAFIANTLHYRRGKGTARILEELGADVGGVGCIAVEYFQRLARLQHLADVRAERPTLAELRPGNTASEAGIAFDVLPRLADLRSIAHAGGRHHVPHIGVHFVRPQILSFNAPDNLVSVEDVHALPAMRPWPDGGGTIRPGFFQLAAQPGEPLRLFNPSRRDPSGKARVDKVSLPDRLRRLALHQETEALRLNQRVGPAAQPIMGWFDKNRPFALFWRRSGSAVFERIAAEQILIANLESFPSARPAASKTYRWWKNGATSADTRDADIACAFDPATGRLVVASPGAQSEVEEIRAAFSFALGAELGAGPQDRNTTDLPFEVQDSETILPFIRIVNATEAETGAANARSRRVQTLAAALAEWDAHGSATRAFIVLECCDREALAGPATRFEVAVHAGSELHIVSAQWRVPRIGPSIPVVAGRHGYIVRKDRRFTIDGRLHLLPRSSGALPKGVVYLDGLEITGGITLAADALSELVVRHCTIRRPGDAAIAATARLKGVAMRIERSIAGRLRLDFGTEPGSGELNISESVIGSDGSGQGALSARDFDARLDNVTLLGESEFKSLEATNVLFMAPATSVRTQAGCVRLSWVSPGSSLPRRYRCQPDLALAAAANRKGSALSLQEADSVAAGIAPTLLDTALYEPTLAMLGGSVSDAIAVGGEMDAEMGAFAGAAQRLRMRNLQGLFDDFIPFGLEAGVIDDTRSSAVAKQRNQP